MTAATFTQPDYTDPAQSGSVYPNNIDAAIAVMARVAASFAAHQQTVGSPAPDLSVRVDAGCIFASPTLTEVAAQTVSGFTTPAAGQTRVDRVVTDVVTGAATRVAGTPVAGSPQAVAPAIPTGKLPCCQIAFTSTDTVITNSMITDERVGGGGGSATAATQAQMETPTGNVEVVTPLSLNWHPGAAKAWCKANVAGGVTVGWNMTSVTDGGTGVITFNVATDFSSADWVTLVQCLNAADVDQVISELTTAAGSCLAHRAIYGGSLIDPTAWLFAGYGDQ